MERKCGYPQNIHYHLFPHPYALLEVLGSNRFIISIIALFILALPLAYAVAPTPPPNIIYYVPVTISNYQNAPFTNNVPIMIGVSGGSSVISSGVVTSSVGGVVTGVNTIPYQQYFAYNDINYEFFDAGGNVITSWLEGNIAYQNVFAPYNFELNWNGLAASATSANAPYLQSNLTWWVQPKPYIYSELGAGSAWAPTTVTIYLGWSGNLVATGAEHAANQLMGNVVSGAMATGEAPQLSCDLGATTTAKCKTYSAFDNGNYLFGNGAQGVGTGGWEANFTGTSLPGFLTDVIGGGASTVTVTNDLRLHTAAVVGDSVIVYSTTSYPANIMSALLNSTITNHWTVNVGLGTAGSGSVDDQGLADSYAASASQAPIFNLQLFQISGSTITSTSNTIVAPSVMTATWMTTGNEWASWDYNVWASATDSTQAVAAKLYGYVSLQADNANAKTVTLQWLRESVAPPNGINPGTSFGRIVLSVAAVNAFAPTTTNNPILNNEGTTLTVNASGGLQPYTYQWYSLPGKTAPTCTSANAIAGATSSTYTTDPSTATTYAYQVTDSHTTNSVACSPGLTIWLPLAATANTFTLSNLTIDVGQVSIANTVISGGIGGGVYAPYTGEWTWYSANMLLNRETQTIIAGVNQIGDLPSQITSLNNSVLYIGMCPNAVGNGKILQTASLTTYTVINTIPTITACVDSMFLNPVPSAQKLYLPYYAFGSTTFNLGIFNTATNALTEVGQTSIGQSGWGTISPNGATIFGGAGSNIILINSATQATSIVPLPLGGVMYNINSNPFYPNVYGIDFNGGAPGNVYIFNTTTDAFTNTLRMATAPLQGSTSRNGTYFYVADDDANVLTYYSNNDVLKSNTIFGPYPESSSFGLNPTGTLGILDENVAPNAIVIVDLLNGKVENIVPGLAGDDVTVNLLGTQTYGVNSVTGNIIVVGNLPETAVQALPASNVLQLTINAISSNTLDFTFNGVSYSETTGTSNTLYGTWTFTGFAQDNNTAYYFGSNTVLVVNSLTINPLLQVDKVYSSNSPGTAGNWETITGNFFGGTSSYTENFFITNSVNGAVIANSLVSGIVVAGSNTYTFQLPSVVNDCGTLNIQYSVTDNASTRVTNSITNTVVVNGCTGGYSAPTITLGNPSNSIVDQGQWQSITATITNGAANYALSYNVVNSIALSKTVNVLTVSGLVGTTNTMTWFVGANEPANSPIDVNVMVVDSHPSTANSIYQTYNAYPTLQAPTLAITNTLIDYGQYSLFTPTITGGANDPDYVENIIISNSVTLKPINSVQATVTTGTAELIYFPSWYASTNTLQVNVVITDSATTNAIANSIYTPLGFNALLVAPTIAVSNTAVDAGFHIRNLLRI